MSNRAFETHEVERNSEYPCDGIKVDGGKFATVVVALLFPVIIQRLQSADRAGVLLVSQYFHDAILMATNQYQVRVLDMVQQAFSNLRVEVRTNIVTFRIEVES